jgi:hypothetical protein
MGVDGCCSWFVGGDDVRENGKEKREGEMGDICFK